MNQADRDRLVALKKARKKLITQRAAAEELDLSVRQVQRLKKAMEEHGDQCVVHGLRGQASNSKLDVEVEKQAMKILAQPVYKDFGPTLASEYLAKKHRIEVSKETVRQWMMRAGLWQGKKARLQKIHTWRERRSRVGELVQWDTSTHDWLEGRGERLYLIAMIDDATSRLMARFVRHDSTEENMRMLWSYLEKMGRPVAFYTDKASLFQVAQKRKRDEPGVDKDPVEMPPTQIGRALQELGIAWIAAHSAQAKGRVERNFEKAQDRLVKGMRVEGIKTIEGANRYLEGDYLVWWERQMTVAAAHADNAHRPLDNSHNLAASLSHVEKRQVRNDYTIRWDGSLYQIERSAIVTGLRGAFVRVEQRLDQSVAVRYNERYLPVKRCSAADPAKLPAPAEQPERQKATRRTYQRGSDWNRDFDLKKAPEIWLAAKASGYRKQDC